MNPGEQYWCIALTNQQTEKKEAGETKFLELYLVFNAFKKDMNQFWQDAYGKSFEFPMPYKLTNSYNIQVALNLVACIIKNSVYPNDQLRSLAGIDLKRSQPDYFFTNLYTKIRDGLYLPKYFLVRVFLALFLMKSRKQG
jgi:hypothetical protein